MLEYKTEIEHKIEEIQKKLKDIETRARQGFDLANNCFKRPLECNPESLTKFLNYMNEDIKRRQKVHSAWGFHMPKASGMDNPEEETQEGLLKEIEVTYTYNRGQGDDIAKVAENRKDINSVVTDEVSLLFSKGATTHNDLQKEKDKDLYFSKFPEGNMDEILNAQDRIALMTAARLARILELRSSMISSASTSEMTLQNQENL